MREGGNVSLTVGKHGSDGGKAGGFQGDNSQIGEHGLGENNAGDDQNRRGNDGTQRVGQNVAEDQTLVAGAKSPGGQDVLLVLETVELGTHAVSDTDPAGEHEGKQKADQGTDLICQMHLEQGHHHQEGNGGQHVGDTLQNQVHRAAVVAFNGAVNDTDDEVQHGYGDGQQEGQTGRIAQAGEDILTMLVGTQQMVGIEAVGVVIVFFVENAAAVSGLVLDRVGVPGLAVGSAIVSFDSLGVIFGSVGIGGGMVVRYENGISLLIMMGREALVGGRIVSQLIPQVRAVGDSDELCLVVGGHGINDLDIILILIVLQGKIFFLRQIHKDEAYFIVGIHIELVESGALVGILIDVADLLHGGVVQLVADGGQIVISCLGLVLNLAAVPAQESKGFTAGQQHLVVTVTEGNIVGRDQRNKQGVQQKQQNDDGCHHGGLVFPEADHGVLEGADGFGGQLLVGQLAGGFPLFKLISGNVFILFVEFFVHISALPS